MLNTTLEIIRAGLRADHTIGPAERDRLIKLLQAPPPPNGVEPTVIAAKVVSRQEASESLNCSVRLVDRLAAEGYLRRVMLPNRKRAIGFSEASVRALLAQGPKAQARKCAL